MLPMRRRARRRWSPKGKLSAKKERRHAFAPKANAMMKRDEMKRALALLLCPSILAAQIGGGGINNPPTPGANYPVVFNNTPGRLQNLRTGADGPNTNASGNLAGNRMYTNFTVPFGNTLTINDLL